MALDRRFLNVRLRVEGIANNSADTVNGRQFIVGTAPTGNFATAAANDIASYDGYKNRWNFYKPQEDNIEIFNIEAGKFGGSYYLEASTLFRDQATGEDYPSEFVIPNCKVQSNFTFTMAPTGDPSTFTFTSTSKVRTPCSAAFLPASSAATCAA